jgi:type I restriction enzyme, S subunit
VSNATKVTALTARSLVAGRRFKRAAPIYYDDLGRFTFLLPPIDVQARLAQLLDAAAHHISLLYRQVAALRAQKRGLMQKLLTGQWRLPAQEEAS